jgi:argininosuccinate synthase
MSKAKKVVVAYSGGLDTTVVIPWLVENYGCEVIAYVGDVGQGEEELQGIREKAIRTGASECYIDDLRREFVEDYVYPTMITGAVYEGKYLLGTAIARPILAKGQVDCARKVGADALAHGCTGKGNDQVRFEGAYAALAPDMKIIAPWREWSLRSREDLLGFLAKRNIPTTASLTKIYSRDRNLWHMSHEGAGIENPWNAPPEDAWTMTVSPEAAPNTPEEVTIGIEKGRPVSLNGKHLAGEEMVAALNKIAGKHGVGRIDLVENRLVGMKSRGLYETPGGTVLVEAMRGVEHLVLDRETLHFREHLGLLFAEQVYNGRWFTPLREALWAAADNIAQRLTGKVVVKLYKGTATAIKRQSDNSLYAEQYATFGADEVYNQKHAEGFNRLWHLPARIAGSQALQAETVH